MKRKQQWVRLTLALASPVLGYTSLGSSLAWQDAFWYNDIYGKTDFINKMQTNILILLKVSMIYSGKSNEFVNVHLFQDSFSDLQISNYNNFN